MSYFVACPIRFDFFKVKAELKAPFHHRERCFRYWHDPNDLHMTLFFRYELNTVDIDKIKGVLSNLAQTTHEFILTGQAVDGIPSKKPHYLALMIQAHPTLASLKAELDEQLEACDFSRESRDFLPHVSLARIKSDGASWHCALSQACQISISDIALYQSASLDNGERYAIISSYAFLPVLNDKG